MTAGAVLAILVASRGSGTPGKGRQSPSVRENLRVLQSGYGPAASRCIILAMVCPDCGSERIANLKITRTLTFVGEEGVVETDDTFPDGYVCLDCEWEGDFKPRRVWYL